jgi:hypothetical protein
MADLVADLKRLRLYGMAACYADGLEHGHAVLTTATPGLAQLVQAEATDRATRSIRYQMHVARFRFNATSPASISTRRRSIAARSPALPRPASPSRPNTSC